MFLGFFALGLAGTATSRVAALRKEVEVQELRAELRGRPPAS